MKKVFKTSLILISIVIIISGSCVAVFAHPGKTDSDGGHFDRSTGEYHYHHGYPAHQHENGTCPYDFKNNEKSTEKYYNYEETTTKVQTAEIETFATIIVENNTKSNNSNEIDYDSLRKKAKINDWVQEYLNNYEKLNNYYSSARQQISNTNTCEPELYSNFSSLNKKVIASLPNYKKYISDDKYNEIQKQTKLYKNFLDNNNPNDLEYIETITEETHTSIFNNMSTVEKVFIIICYCFFGIYIFEVIILAIILSISHIKEIRNGYVPLKNILVSILIFLTYIYISYVYFSFLFKSETNIYFLFFFYLPAPIISTYILYIFIRDTIAEKKNKRR